MKYHYEIDFPVRNCENAQYLHPLRPALFTLSFVLFSRLNLRELIFSLFHCCLSPRLSSMLRSCDTHYFFCPFVAKLAAGVPVPPIRKDITGSGGDKYVGLQQKSILLLLIPSPSFSIHRSGSP